MRCGVDDELWVEVDLAGELDVADWARRNAAGEVPDGSPYGLHRLAAHGVQPVFRAPPGALTRWAARKVRNRTDGTEVVPAVVGALRGTARDRAAVLCMDERTGLPAALLPGGPPVFSGIAWVTPPALIGPLHRRTLSLALPRMAATWTNVTSMVPVLVEDWGLAADTVHVVPLGIDAEFFPAQPWPEQPGLVVSAGEDRMRDHDTLVAAVALAHAQEPAVRLELATRLPVPVGPELVTVHRRRMNGEMRGLYRRSTVVALALHPNPQGSGLTVVLEAMASGRPVVVTDNPGIADYVEDGRTGTLVPPGDAGAMARAALELVGDPARARAMGAAGRAAVERRFTTDAMAGHLATLLHTVA